MLKIQSLDILLIKAKKPPFLCLIGKVVFCIYLILNRLNYQKRPSQDNKQQQHTTFFNMEFEIDTIAL
jgi:hypothetical protein